MTLTHFDAGGNAHMVDVSDKAVTARLAVAEGHVRMTAETLALITENRAAKGDVLAVARLAGIMGDRVRHIAVDGEYRMRLDALAERRVRPRRRNRARRSAVRGCLARRTLAGCRLPGGRGRLPGRASRTASGGRGRRLGQGANAR